MESGRVAESDISGGRRRTGSTRLESHHTHTTAAATPSVNSIFSSVAPAAAHVCDGERHHVMPPRDAAA